CQGRRSGPSQDVHGRGSCAEAQRSKPGDGSTGLRIHQEASGTARRTARFGTNADGGGCEVTEPIPAIVTPAENAPIAPSRDEGDEQSGWLASFQSLISTVVIAVFAISFIIQAFQIPTGSMENTLLVGDLLLVDKVRFGTGIVGKHLLP